LGKHTCEEKKGEPHKIRKQSHAPFCERKDEEKPVNA